MRKKRVFSKLGQMSCILGMAFILSTAFVTQATAKSLKSYVSGQEEIIVTGTVSDKSGTLPGVTVLEKNTTNGSATDIEGKYTLRVAKGAILQFSFVGYKTQEIVVGNQAVIDVVLEPDNRQLEEVVVVGYGTQKKVNLTGSVASVSADEIKERVNTDVLKAVQGTVPGVTVISRPGQTPSINFRGRGNLGTSAPLYVIDGVIADASFFSNLDPNTIESISFLKDAASSAIYGSRAAYGVVLVTTKQGKKEKLNVTYNGYVGMKMPTYLPDIVSSAEYAELMNEAAYNRNSDQGKYQSYSEEEIRKFRDGSDPDHYPNTDWADLVLDKHVVTTQHSLSFNGGSDKVQYFASLGYLYDDNFMPGQDNRRYNMNLNVTSDINAWLTLKGGIKYIRNTGETRHGVASIMNFLLVPPTMVARHSNGEWGSIAGGKPATQSFINGNPLRALSKKNWSNSKTDNTIFEMGFDLKPVKGLIISGQGVFKGYEYKYKSYTALQDNIKDFTSGDEIQGTGVYTNSMEMDWRSTTKMLYTATAKYNWTNQVHDVTLLAGMSYEHYKYERLYGKRKNFPTDDLKDLGAGSSAGENVSNEGGITENKLLSYFGRLNYSLWDRYLFEANLRADASSSFYKDNRWGIFPSFSLGWRISEEDFMKDIHWIDNLKIRGSWGQLGNINNVGDYDYFQNYATDANYNFDNQAVVGIVESKPANTSLSWETVTLTDFGIDWDILKGNLNITADYYIKKTKDILLGYNVAAETGIVTAPSQNIGKVENKGFELALTHSHSFGKFSYTISGNIATNRNRVVDMGTSNNKIENGGDKVKFILKEGHSIGSFYGYKTNGLYTQQEIDEGHYYIFGRTPKAGDIKYVPQRKDVPWKSSITDDDRTIIGCDVPNFTYGININLRYANFELSAFGQGVSGTKVGFESEQVWAFFLNSSPRKYHLKRWTQENPNPRAAYPRIYGGNSLDDYNQYFSDFQLFDADYFRIKTLTLSYMMPNSLVRKWGLTSLKFYVTGENLFTIRADHKMKDFDPESPTGRGLGALGTKSVAFGLNLSF